MPTTGLGRIRHILLPALVLASTSLLLAACSRSQPENPTTFSATIGKSGGTLETEPGVLLAIPEGALKKRETIEVRPYLDPAEIPVEIGRFALDEYSVIELLPDGLTFETPVTITIPSARVLEPGLEFPLYYWNRDELQWEVTDFIARVKEDGRSYSADITHFSAYSGGGEGSGGGYYDGFDPDKIDCGSEDWAVQFQFDDWMRDLETVSGLDSVGHGIPDPGCCKVIAGQEFVLRFSKCGVNYPEMRKVLGDISDPDEVRTYPPKKIFDPSSGFFLYQEIKDYIIRAAPSSMEFRSLSACMDLSCSDGKDEQQVEVVVTCGTHNIFTSVGLPGAQIEWQADGVGSVDPSMRFTDESGSATTTLTVDDKGLTRVSATARTCQGTPDFNEKRVLSEMICVDDCDKMMLTLEMTFTHSGADVPWEFQDRIVAYVEYTIDEETGQISSGKSEGSQDVAVQSVTEHCEPTAIQAPNFTLKVEGNVTQDTTHVQIVPNSLPAGFTFHCQYPTMDEPIDVPVPPYSSLLGSIMGKYLDLELPGRCNKNLTGFVRDAGSEGFGADPPIQFEYMVTTTCIERECKMCQ